MDSNVISFHNSLGVFRKYGIVGFSHKALSTKALLSYRAHSADAWEWSKTNPQLWYAPDITI